MQEAVVETATNLRLGDAWVGTWRRGAWDVVKRMEEKLEAIMQEHLTFSTSCSCSSGRGERRESGGDKGGEGR